MTEVVQAVRLDEGTTSPYMARLWVGIMELRDAILLESDGRRRFDEHYEPVLKALDKARETAREIQTLVSQHHREVMEPGAVELDSSGQITVHLPINDQLDRRFDSFTVFAHRAMKLTQHVVKGIAAVDVGFLFKNSANFESAHHDLQDSRPDLAAYLLAVRHQLTDQLARLRNDIEHKGWNMPGMRYRVHDGQFQVGEANIGALAFTAYVQQVLSGAIRFVEDMTAYALQTRIEKPRAIIELPDVQRASLLPKRFALAFHGDYRSWRVAWANDDTDFLWKGN